MGSWFLLVSGRHVGAHRMGTNMGSPYKSLSIWGKASPHILHKKYCCDLNLDENLCIVSFFLFSESGLNLF